MVSGHVARRLLRRREWGVGREHVGWLAGERRLQSVHRRRNRCQLLLLLLLLLRRHCLLKVLLLLLHVLLLGSMRCSGHRNSLMVCSRRGRVLLRCRHRSVLVRSHDRLLLCGGHGLLLRSNSRLLLLLLHLLHGSRCGGSCVGAHLAAPRERGHGSGVMSAARERRQHVLRPTSCRRLLHRNRSGSGLMLHGRHSDCLRVRRRLLLHMLVYRRDSRQFCVLRGLRLLRHMRLVRSVRLVGGVCLRLRVCLCLGVHCLHLGMDCRRRCCSGAGFGSRQVWLHRLQRCGERRDRGHTRHATQRRRRCRLRRGERWLQRKHAGQR